MANIGPSALENVYQQLLQVGSGNIGLTSSYQVVQDGSGTNSTLGLSSASVYIDSFTLHLTSNASLSGTVSGNGTVATAGHILTLTNDGSISGTNTGDQNLFSTFAVSGQSNVVAATSSDTATFVSGAGMTITTNAGTKSVTFSVSSVVISSAAQVFTSGSGTYTPTSGMLFIKVRMCGGGKGGGGTSNAGAYASATGGNSGGYLEFFMSAAQVGASLSYAVGAGGAGGSAGLNNGTNGNDTTFGTWIAKGGTGGGNAMAGAATNPVISASASSNTANTVGTGTTILNIAGNRAEVGISTSAFGIISKGGGNYLSITLVTPPSLVYVLPTVSGNAAAAEVYGRGGDGAINVNSASAYAGGAGATGVIIIEEFI